MTLNATHLRKMGDENTRRALSAAGYDTRLRAILTVAGSVLDGDHDHQPHAKETREQMRARMIRSRRERTERSLKPIIATLTRYGLDLKGGNSPRLSRLLVVDGAAAAILDCAELPEVQSVQIDRKFTVTAGGDDSTASALVMPV